MLTDNAISLMNAEDIVGTDIQAAHGFSSAAWEQWAKSHNFKQQARLMPLKPVHFPGFGIAMGENYTAGSCLLEQPA